MASTGFTLATAGTTLGDGANPWTNPGNITADDGTNTTTPFGASSTSDSLLAAGFGFSVPAGSTIDGVEVRYERNTFGSEPSQFVTSATIQLANAGSAIGTADTDLTDWTSLAVVTRGSSSDTWGAALTAEIVNSATFGPRIAATWDSGLGTDEVGLIDYVQVNVHYTPAVGSPDLLLLGAG